jgi:hypothetical protein
MLIKCGSSWTLVLVVESVRCVALDKRARGLVDASWSLLVAFSMNWKVRPSPCRNLSSETYFEMTYSYAESVLFLSNETFTAPARLPRNRKEGKW